MKHFRLASIFLVAMCLATVPFAAAAATVSGSLSAPPNGLRWGQDAIVYRDGGTCTGAVMDFRRQAIHGGYLVPGIGLYDTATGRSVGGGSYTQTVQCVGGHYDVVLSLGLVWFIKYVAGTPWPGQVGGLMPGTYSVYAEVSYPADGPFSPAPISNTPSLGTSVYFDHPYTILELNTALTPLGGGARYVDPASSPVGLPPGMPSPQLIEVSNTSLAITLPIPAADGTLWIYDQVGSLAPGWRAVRNSDGDTLITGNTIYVRAWSAPSYLAFSYTRQVTPVMPQADLWWGGADESGWGLSIGRNGEALFVAGYLYDYNGKSTWFVMQGGSWDESHTVWTGDVYIPNGTPLDHYDASKLDMGSSNGKSTLRFTSPTTATFQYLGGYTHALSRFEFGAGDAGPYHGYWWGGASQNGWGLHVAQQGDTVFATWYTYGADGRPTWLYMPGATKVADGHYKGTLYRTSGGSWPTQEHYDSSATKVTVAGTLDLAFTGDSAGTMTAVVDGKTIVNPIQRFGF